MPPSPTTKMTEVGTQHIATRSWHTTHRHTTLLKRLHLTKTKTKPGLLLVKQEHLAMAADDKTALKWSRDEYVWEEMERQRRALEEIAARRASRPRQQRRGGVGAFEPRLPRRPRAGLQQGRWRSGWQGGDDDGGDYTNLYNLFGMRKAAA
ncbi:hypothetical protein D1007_47768 [Hordeum vulgare]|nr:hypothetical protein D1007_47768 [Hordeum vulgare]